MQLRPRQKTFVTKTLSALREHGNTLGIAPTGAGKTVMMGATLRDLDGKHLVLQHREELVTQNASTFAVLDPGRKQSIINANVKDPSGDTVFAMVQTLVRNLDRVPEVSVLAIDEAHHAPATTYRKIIDAAYQRNPDLMILGVTATPVRGDKAGLRTVFDNVSDQVTLTELVKAGHLVKPRCFAVDIGVAEEVLNVRKKGDEYDPDAVAEIMDKRVHNERVIDEWEGKARERQTVVFASTVEHAQHLADLWCERGYKAACVWGDMGEFQRKKILEAYDRGEIQVITNVMVLTEGWDHQPTSCVVLTRPLSFKGTMLQMIGRGLRKVDPERYPGIHKDDCIVLDFGATLLAHGSLETQPTIESDQIIKCPECSAALPAGSKVCSLCGFEIAVAEEAAAAAQEEDIFADQTGREDLTDFVMTEIDIMEASPFRWENFFDDKVTICTAIDAWCALVFYQNRWVAIGCVKGNGGSRVIGDAADYLSVLATADDFMRVHGDTDMGNKTKAWQRRQVTGKQTINLQKLGWGVGDIMPMTSYRAACALTWGWNEKRIKHLVTTAVERIAA